MRGRRKGRFPRAAISWYAGDQHDYYPDGYHGLAAALTQLSITAPDGIAGILVNAKPADETLGLSAFTEIRRLSRFSFR
ncbi:hypothetical protein ACQP2U_24405 [Nocardia sp. CA-084685]|uniref:hypothetical protein n=1 Tax=Nocardia sp. CA-084685 TaxID=3239970 RepID=UPI003D99DF05